MKPTPVENLNNRVEQVTLFVPSNERRVIVQDYSDNNPTAVTAIYKNGNWFGATTGYHLDLSEEAVWSEMYLK